MRRVTLTLCLAVVGLAIGAIPASATEVVDDDGSHCPNRAHSTIQAGVNAASVNEQVLVCNGVYREQVYIGPTKNGVDVVSNALRGATIKAPTTPLTSPEALVFIDRASNAKIRRFIIAGPGPGTAESLLHGVLVETDPGDVAASVHDNLITDITDSTPAANQEGIGVRVGRNYAGTVGRGSVLRNEIVRYQKGGVVIDGDGSFANVGTNTIKGLGPVTTAIPPGPAQQGIQISRGAGAVVTANNISDNQYGIANPDPDPTTPENEGQFTSFGVLLFNTDLGGSRLQSNTVTRNDYGVLLQDVENWLIKSNRVFGNGDTGRPSADGGIGVFETAPGIGNNNTFDHNDARTNVGLDCEDGTKPLNSWLGNRGVDDSPPQICAP